MPLILDTFNVLHTTGVLPPDLAGLDVAGLAMLIARSRYREERTTFVCDGQPPDPAAGAIRLTDLPPPGPLIIEIGDNRAGSSAEDRFRVRYSGRAATADDLIRDMVRASTAPRRMIVVSSDHAVQREARKRKCEVLSADEFLQHLALDAHLADRAIPRAPARPVDPAMSAEQVERWKRVFNIDAAAIDAEVDAGAERRMQARQDVSQPERPQQAADAPSRSSAHVDSAAIAPGAPAASGDVDVRPPPLPADLIAQAETLWQNEQARQARTIAAKTPDPPRPAPSTPTSLAREGASPATVDHPDLESQLAALDMNAILPPDDQTRPLPTSNQRHRPPPPSATSRT